MSFTIRSAEWRAVALAVPADARRGLHLGPPRRGGATRLRRGGSPLGGPRADLVRRIGGLPMSAAKGALTRARRFRPFARAEILPVDPRKF